MIIKKFEEQEAKNPGKLAVVTDKKQLTYRELNNYANYVAQAILNLKYNINSAVPGGESQQVVGLLFEHSADMIISVLGTLKAGEIYVPLDITYPMNRLEYMLNNSGAYLVLTNTLNWPLAQELAGKVKNNLKLINIDTLGIDRKTVIENIQRSPSGNTLAYILYTSGSTGSPKGVMQNHENVCYYIRNWIERFSITSSDRMTLFSAFSHDGAVQDMFGALHSGATLYPYNILNHPNIAELRQWLIDEKITIWHSVPTLYRYFIDTLKTPDNHSNYIADFRFILLGGEQIRTHDIEMFKTFFPGAQFANVYGQTESSVSSIWIIKPGDVVNKMLIGTPLNNTCLLILSEQGEIIENIGVGEIYICCPHIALGYWKDVEKTGQVFLHDPELGKLYRTGDLGRLMADGSIEIMGRKDSQVKIRGFRVEVGEIETRLLKHKAIREVVVISKRDETGNDHLCAYYALNTSESGKEFTLTVSELREYISNELPEYMIPSYFMQLEKLPVTPNGKVDRKKLPELEHTRPQLKVTYVAPETDIERKITEIWGEALKLDKVGVYDNFFDLGGTSFDILKITSKLYEVFKKDISVISIFRYPTIRAFVDYLKQDNVVGITAEKRIHKVGEKKVMDVAVIGMSVRFPGSRNLDEFWENIKNGVNSISIFSDKELLEESQVDPLVLDNPNFIKAKGIIKDIEYFDSVFFNYTPVEAEIMDPQLRIMHECCWEALENGGYDPESYKGLIGLYAGNAPNYYWVNLLRLNNKSFADTGFLINNYSTTVSYKLNLRGPSLILQTACSTALVGIHLACKGLRDYESDMALAGGVSIVLPNKSGYMYQEGMIYSKDGQCRAFDAKASGTVFGNGACMVLLKRLEEAVEDGDTIYAVIKGTAINNDGRRKVGLSAPSIEGQVDVIQSVLRETGIDPESIGYIEAHGTGTILGDPIEIEALKLAFNTDKKQYCKIGSVKANIGHLNVASGAAGFIKAALALKHRMIPPAVSFESPNPAIDFKNSPFFIDTELTEWKNDKYPLRAGVSSFGIGGTNAHVILEEALVFEATSASRPTKMLVLSAGASSTLEKMTENMSIYFEKKPDIDLADAVYTLQVGRKAFKYRRVALCSSIEEAVELLNASSQKHPIDEWKLMTGASIEGLKRVIFMFPGQGSQYVNMGLELYLGEKLFREEMDRCFNILKPLLAFDIKEILYPTAGAKLLGLPGIDQTEVTQVVLFIVEYSLAGLLMKWGIKPYAMIGHSIGEYAAACLSGVLSLEDALKAVALRGKLMQQVPAGSMLSVSISEDQLKPFVDSEEEISIAAVNTTSYCVVSGPHAAIERLEKQLNEKGYDCKRLHTSHAFHSSMMDPVLREFEQKIGEVSLNKPLIPYISNVTGKWISVEDASNPGYWSGHLRRTVRFGDGLAELLKESRAIFLEVGPGRSLSTFVRQHKDKKEEHLGLNLIRHPNENVSDLYYLLSRIGKLWLNGGAIDWNGFNAGEKRRRIPLPTYPFEKRRYWLDGTGDLLNINQAVAAPRLTKQSDISRWFYAPSWNTSFTPGPAKKSDKKTQMFVWMLFSDGSAIEDRLRTRLEMEGHDVVVVKPGVEFCGIGKHEYIIDPGNEENYHTLLRERCEAGKIPTRIVYMWSLVGNHMDHNHAIEMGFFSLVSLARAIGSQLATENIQISVLTDRAQFVTGDEELHPDQSIGAGPVRVIPKEYYNIMCRNIDIDLAFFEARDSNKDLLVSQLYTELLVDEINDSFIAFRGNYRWVKGFESLPIGEPGDEKISRLREGGVYVITGGLGGIGLTLAEYLAKTVKAKLVLTSRNSGNHEIWKVRQLEELGAEVLVLNADVSDKERMRQVVQQAKDRFGTINGVIHAAGVPDGGVIQLRTRDISERVFASKITGTLALDEILKDIRLDFFLLCSSISALTGPMGQVAYSAANAFMDSFAYYKNSTGASYTVSVNWDSWKEVGMAVNAVKKLAAKESLITPIPGQSKESVLLKDSISPQEGVEVFRRILGGDGWSQVVVSTLDLPQRLKNDTLRSASKTEKEPMNIKRSESKYSRPELNSDYAAPVTEIEKVLASIWEELLRIEIVGIYDDFFQLGGDSLKAVNFKGRIQKELNVEVPISEFFNRPTIKKLGEYIEGNTRDYKFSSILPAEEKEYYGVSTGQGRLYILYQLEERNTAYNLSDVLLMKYDIDIEKIRNIFTRLIRRHEILRTSFEIIDGKPAQRIHDTVEFEIEYFESISGSPFQIVSDFIRPFDLSRAPLMRAGVIKLAEKKYILMMDVHHIVFDGASFLIFHKEFLALDKEEVLPPLKLQYKDYSEWQKNHEENERKKKQEAYWLNALSGELPVLNLPLDFPRPIFQSFEGSRLSFSFEREEADRLRAIVREEEATLFMILLAVFDVLLMKLSGQEDIIVGTPVAGRTHADLEKIIGMFVNTLAIRNSVSGEMSYREFVKELKERTLNVFENQDYPFETLVEKINVVRDIGRNPVFDVMFNLLNREESKGEISDTNEDDVYAPKEGTSTFDITLTAVDFGERVYLSFEYCTRLFKLSTIERFISYFKKIVEELSANIDQNLSEIEIITQDEKYRILYDFNDTQADYPKDKTIHRLFEDQVDKIPDHIALVFDDKMVTYREFDERANRLAHYLIEEKGVCVGDRVAVLMDRSIELIVTLMGVLKSGGAYLPINPKNPQERIDFIIKDSGAQPLNFSTSQLLISFSSVSSVRSVRKNLLPTPLLAYVMYTSGSSGTPKGVLVEHRTIVNTLDWRRRNYEYGPGNASLQIPPYFFDSSVTDIFTPLLGGARLVLIKEEERIDLEALKRIIPKNKVTHFIVVPVFYNVMLEEIHEYLKGVKMITCAGDNFPDELIRKHFERLPNVRIFNEYGPTENSVNTSAYELKPESPKALIGKPITNVQIYILDRNMNIAPIGVMGEICLAGSSLALGYLNRPELTSEKFINQGLFLLILPKNVQNKQSFLTSGLENVFSEHFAPGDAIPFLKKPPLDPTKIFVNRIYKTGDLARFFSDGNIEFLGRDDAQVKIRGIRIETGEIENHLMKREDIKEVLVLACESSIKGKYLCAYIVATNKNLVIDMDLKGYLSKRLPEYMIPSYFIEIESIPTLPNGKINKELLPAPEISKEAHTAPRNNIEVKLVEIWGEILAAPMETISIDADFFKLGGHSLKATILASRAHKAFNVKLPLTEIFKTPTIRGISKYLNEANEERYASIEPVEKKEYYLLSSAQKRLFILNRMNPDSAAYNMPQVIPLSMEIEIEKLESTFKELINRHESLRTSFHMVDDTPVQKIHDKVDFSIEYLTTESGLRPFDLSKAPLMRVGLIKEENGVSLLFVDMNHIITDGFSQAILAKEFNLIFEGRGEELAPLRLQYKDYARWQKSEENNELMKGQETFWLREYSGEIPALNLPTDNPRPLAQSFEGESDYLIIDEIITRKLKEYAQAEGATLYIVLLGAVNILLSRMSGQEDIIVGTPTAGRRHADLEKIIGIFVNTIALRNRPKEEQPITEFIHDVKERTLESFENQEYQFEDLVEKLDINRDPGRNPLFDVMFVLQNVEGPSAERTENGNKIGTSKFDISITAGETVRGIDFSFQYCTKLFKKETIRRYMSYLREIITGIVESPEMTLSQIGIIPGEEKNRLLVEFNDSDTEYPKDKTIHRLFEEQEERTPDRIAIVGLTGQITYRELNEKSSSLARELMGRGIKLGDIIGIKMDRSIEMIVAMLGILKAGGAYLPIAINNPQERIDYMIKDSNAEILLNDELSINSDVWDRHTCPSSSMSLVAYIIYTSGSTGRPKGVMVEHRNVVRLVKNPNFIETKEGQRLLMTGQYTFDIVTFEIWWPLLNGLIVIQADENAVLNPEEMEKIVTMNRIDILHLVPQLFNRLYTHKPGIFERLSYFLVGGDLVAPREIRDLRNRYEKLKILHMYGPTEGATFSTYLEVGKLDENDRSLPIGKPVNNTTVYILGSHEEILPIGVVGELCVGGAGVARGYLNNPEMTVEKFITLTLNTNTIYKTGDLARWLDDGNIEFLGRMDYQVKVRGIRVELGEIEKHLKAHEGIKEVVVVDRNENGRQYLCGYFVKELGAEEGKRWVEELKESIEGKLPAYMIPACFVEIEKIPLNANGKLDRKALPQPLENDFHTGGEYEAPINDLQRIIVEIWQDVLGREKVGIQDNFFDIGGNSLDFVKVGSKLKEKLNEEIAVVTLFTYPTISSLAHYLSRDREKESENERSPEIEELIDEGKGLMFHALRKIDNE